MRSLAVVGYALAFAGPLALPSGLHAGSPEAAAVQDSELQPVRMNGVELHYTDRGAGAPIVFVHGGLADYREWEPVAQALPEGFRTVVYSRRHSFPNRNAPPTADHTMLREVEDVVALIEELRLGPVHIVGTSYGAFVALMVALHRPDLVRTVTAAEPPLLHWLRDIEGGREPHDRFYSTVMRPSAAAFASGDSVGALTVALDHFVGPDGINQIPPEVRAMLLANVEDWRAITTAPDALPEVTREQLAALTVPVLFLSGERSADLHRLIDPEAARVIPNAVRVVIAEGSHEMCVEQPAACAAEIGRFIEQQGR